MNRDLRIIDRDELRAYRDCIDETLYLRRKFDQMKDQAVRDDADIERLHNLVIDLYRALPEPGIDAALFNRVLEEVEND